MTITTEAGQTFGRCAPLTACVRAAFALGALHAAHATASTITVANCKDHGSGSLRTALSVAHSGDTVSLASLPACTITLTTAALPVTVGSLKVLGPTSNTVAINAAQNYRVFDHTGTGTLTLDHLVIANGKYRNANASGGCVRSSGSVSLHNTSISACTALADLGKSWGGAIWSAGTVTLINSTISGNLAEAPNGSYGGGVFGKNVNIQNTTINDNSAQFPYGGSPNDNSKFQGGGVFVGSASANIVDSVIDHNFTTGVFTDGAGIFASTSLYVASSSVTNNVAFSSGRAEGGGIFAGTALTLKHSIVSDNQAGANSGAYGGGLRAGSVVMEYSTIHGNYLGSGPNGFSGLFNGGGMFVYQGATQITRSTIDGNHASTGGGVFGFHSNITITNSTISGNFADGSGATVSATGAGIAMQATAGTAATLRVSNSTVAYNVISSAFGTYGGAGIRAYGTAIINSTIIANNFKDGAANDFSCECGLDASPTISGDHNLVVAVDPAGSAPNYGFAINLYDPVGLVPLAYHGGETRTHALDPASAAIGYGTNALGALWDQRGLGYPRNNPDTLTPDVGAYERQPFDDEIFYDGFGVQ